MPSSTTVYPYNAVVYVTVNYPDFSGQASGVLISPDEVLTASHVVYSQDEGTASSITVSPGYNNGSTPYGSVSGVSFHYNPIDDSGDTISGYYSQYDYAVIHLSHPFTGLGTMSYGPGFGGGVVNVTGYPAADNGTQVTTTEYATLDPDYTLIDGTDTGEGSSGGPAWVMGSNGQAEAVGLVSTGDGTYGWDNLITPSEANQIANWVAQDDNPSAAASAPGAGLTAFDQDMQQAVLAKGEAYAGPVSGVQSQFVDVAIDDLNVALSTKNWYVKLGYGDDAVAASGGTNVLDGGAGSNFLTGAAGTDGGHDTFFLDASDPDTTTWDTIVNFHPGDALTLWGFTPGTSVTSWAASDGTKNYTGVTLHASLAGAGTYVDASVTFAGLSLATEQSRFAVTTGRSGGLPYLYVKYT